MNPQSISTSLLIATDYIRAMRGGAQSHMLTANDGHAYVVKFANNPQSLRVLANEWLGCSIGRALGLTIPEPAILYVPATLVESSPSLVIQVSNSTLKCSYGLAFGSLTTCPTRLSHRLKTCESLPAFSRWTDGCATVTVGRSCSAKVNDDEDCALISSTSVFALTSENGTSPTPCYAGFMRINSSIRTCADGSHSNRG
jgi:hypothetical protein